MSGLRLKLDFHSSSITTSAIELDAADHYVTVKLDLTDDRLSADLSLAPDEARALASALIHYASEIEDGRA